MYLKSLKIKNFRKFGEDNNVIEFVSQKDGLISNNINVAKATTLVVGKNNSGKTTIIEAIEKLIEKKSFISNDYNFLYLNKLLEKYKSDNFDEFPEFKFEIEIGLEESDNETDLVTNIIPFLDIENANQQNNIKIIIKYIIEETTEFKEKTRQVINKYRDKDSYVLFQKYLECIDSVKKSIRYFNNFNNNEKPIKDSFKLSSLIDIKTIKANKIITDISLSNIFNKIVQYKYKTENFEDMNEHIDEMNEKVTEKVSDSHEQHINEALHAIESRDRLSIRLNSDINFDILMKQLITYSYIEQGVSIPQGQFGLGYSNLMTIIGEIIDYIEQYNDDNSYSKLNLICIEEPEAFMHPQMQELFIKNINDAISHLLNQSKKRINSQLIVTTHSSHILNSKIHTSNSFDNINYITIVGNKSTVVNLSDENIIDNSESNASTDLKFIKKHIKHKVSELFFSDAIIFVEGITEETLLNYYIDNNDELNKYYISIFNINGAHGLVYHNLIKLLKIPALIITDLDIKRTKLEKEKYIQVTSLKHRKTTNATLLNYYKGTTNSFFEIRCKYLDIKYKNKNVNNYIFKIYNKRLKRFKISFNIFNNIYISTQFERVAGYYATSFEEAYILKNYNNNILNKVLKKLKPQIYKDIVGEPENRNSLKDNSYKLQSKLSNSKSDFANELLYQFSIKDDEEALPVLPEYIQNALNWLKRQLNDNQEVA
jgi:predicted ATP-dependent endonuclease of OLD family